MLLKKEQAKMLKGRHHPIIKLFILLSLVNFNFENL